MRSRAIRGSPPGLFGGSGTVCARGLCRRRTPRPRARRISTPWTTMTIRRTRRVHRTSAARSGVVARRSALRPSDGRSGLFGPRPTGPVSPTAGRPARVFRPWSGSVARRSPLRPTRRPAAGDLCGPSCRFAAAGLFGSQRQSYSRCGHRVSERRSRWPASAGSRRCHRSGPATAAARRRSRRQAGAACRAAAGRAAGSRACATAAATCAARKSASPPRSPRAPSWSIRPTPTSITCSAAAVRFATASASAAMASPGPVCRRSAARPSGRIGIRRPR